MAHYGKKFSVGKRERDMPSLEKGPQVGDPGIQALWRSVSSPLPMPLFLQVQNTLLLMDMHLNNAIIMQ